MHEVDRWRCSTTAPFRPSRTARRLRCSCSTARGAMRTTCCRSASRAGAAPPLAARPRARRRRAAVLPAHRGGVFDEEDLRHRTDELARFVRAARTRQHRSASARRRGILERREHRGKPPAPRAGRAGRRDPPARHDAAHPGDAAPPGGEARVPGRGAGRSARPPLRERALGGDPSGSGSGRYAPLERHGARAEPGRRRRGAGNGRGHDSARVPPGARSWPIAVLPGAQLRRRRARDGALGDRPSTPRACFDASRGRRRASSARPSAPRSPRPCRRRASCSPWRIRSCSPW